MKDASSFSDMLLLNLGGGAIAGLAAGYAFKRLSKIALFFLGACILLLYALMKAGYISVHWDAVSQGLAGGGHTVAHWVEGLVKELSLSLVGFGGGFLLGLKLR